MMDKNPFKHMRDMLVAKPVPKVDVKHKVMAAIRAKENKEEKVVKKKIGLLVTVGMLVGASSVWAGMELIQLKNEKGEVVYEVSQHTDQEQQKMLERLSPEERAKLDALKKESQQRSKIITDILNGLKPGTTAAIYTVPTKEEEERYKDMIFVKGKHPNVDVVTKPIEYKGWKEMEPVVGEMFRLPTELEGGLPFDYGVIHYADSDKYDIEAMKAEAIKDNKKYIVKEIPASNKFDRASVYYKSQKGNVEVEVSLLEDDSNGMGTNAQNIEKVMVGENEAVLAIHIFKDGSVSQWISWVKNGTKLQYMVDASQEVASKDELIKIAKQINETK
ncbi:hypothetical protein [Brevibacillus porteri]|uniref:hypothetical protein n=1 Tax=Brevibacillus porteri TaxID=2126350 RepID=UPI003626C805